MRLISQTTTRKDLLAGFALDLCLGDPRGLPHPVRGVGWLARHFETFWRSTPLPAFYAGAAFWFSVVGTSLGFVRLTLPWANVYWIYSLLACRNLDDEALAVIKALRQGTIVLARTRLSRIVGRDIAHLDEPEIIRAIIETVAENCSDGVIAPLFYLALAGPLGMAFYKVVNTLDSTVGYRNPRYGEFGTWSARADDVLNFIPARLTALLVWIVALFPGFHAVGAIRVTIRDGGSQPSPNAGYPEAAFAGALGVRLGGLNYYGGVPSSKAYLGDPIRPLRHHLYRRARMLLYGSAALTVSLLYARSSTHPSRCS